MDMSRKSMTATPKVNKDSKTKDIIMVSKDSKAKDNKDKVSKDKRTDKDPAVFSEALPKDLARSCLPKLEDSRSIPPTA